MIFTYICCKVLKYIGVFWSYKVAAFAASKVTRGPTSKSQQTWGHSLFSLRVAQFKLLWRQMCANLLDDRR